MTAKEKDVLAFAKDAEAKAKDAAEAAAIVVTALCIKIASPYIFLPPGTLTKVRDSVLLAVASADTEKEAYVAGFIKAREYVREAELAAQEAGALAKSAMLVAREAENERLWLRM